jgi:hypothetical protein
MPSNFKRFTHVFFKSGGHLLLRAPLRDLLPDIFIIRLSVCNLNLIYFFPFEPFRVHLCFTMRCDVRFIASELKYWTLALM